MRFKASLRMPQWKSFWAHLVMMERVGKSVALVFTDTSVRALVQSEADTVMQYSALHTQALFDMFRCESRMNNVIAVEVLIANLIAGLRPGVSSESIILKLTKRDSAQYLRAEMKPREGGVALIQDIPVRVIGGVEMLRYAPPSLPVPAVRVSLPPASSVKSVIERMKGLSKVLGIDIDMAGGGGGGEDVPTASLTLSVTHDLVRVKTFYMGLHAESGGGAGAGAGAGAGGGSGAGGADGDGNIGTTPLPGAKASCAVSIADFSRVLRGVIAIAGESAIAATLSIVPNLACLLHLALEDGTGSITVILSVIGAEA